MYDYTIRIILIGDCAVGKTAFAKKLMKDTFTPIYDATIGVDYSAKTIIKNDENTKFNKIKLKTSTFNKNILNKEIDYLSMDIEGAELDVLQSINFQEYIIKVISVENNNPEKINFNSFLIENNFSFFDRVGQDEIFYNNKFFKLN